MQSKQTFKTLFLITVVLLMALPFLTTFQDLLTRFIMRIEIYKNIQNWIVPYEMKVVSTILNMLGVGVEAGKAYIQFPREGKMEVIYLSWNCIGWQSLIVFLVTLVTGFSGNWKRSSKLEALAIGILGTYLINIFRLVIVILVYYWIGRGIGVVFHDYFSNLLSLAWLFFFWWFSYSFVLEERQ